VVSHVFIPASRSKVLGPLIIERKPLLIIEEVELGEINKIVVGLDRCPHV